MQTAAGLAAKTRSDRLFAAKPGAEAEAEERLAAGRRVGHCPASHLAPEPTRRDLQRLRKARLRRGRRFGALRWFSGPLARRFLFVMRAAILVDEPTPLQRKALEGDVVGNSKIPVAERHRSFTAIRSVADTALHVARGHKGDAVITNTPTQGNRLGIRDNGFQSRLVLR